MDHHCPWINNCVGMMNQKYFLLFLLYSFIFSLSVFSSSMISFFHVIYYPYGLKSVNLLMCSSIETLFVVMILIGAAFSLFFCVFGIAILVDTMRTVVSGSTSRKWVDVIWWTRDWSKERNGIIWLFYSGQFEVRSRVVLSIEKFLVVMARSPWHGLYLQNQSFRTSSS